MTFRAVIREAVAWIATLALSAEIFFIGGFVL